VHTVYACIEHAGLQICIKTAENHCEGNGVGMDNLCVVVCGGLVLSSFMEWFGFNLKQYRKVLTECESGDW